MFEPLEQTLRSALQPITHNLPLPVRNAATQLLGESCYRSLVHNINIQDVDCLKLAISKALGVGIVATSSIVKIPQLLKLLNSQSAEGISFLSYLLETISYVVTVSYNVRRGFPFSTYGEIALIVIQNIAISVLVLQYSGRAPVAVAFVAALAAAGYALNTTSVTPMGTLQYLQAGAGVLGVASKLPQILTIFSEGTTGQLSAFQVFMYLGGSLSRIFTTLQEVPDPLILYGFVAGFLLNAVLAAQMAYYWNSGKGKSRASVTTKPMAQKSSSASASGASGRGKNTPSTRRRG